MKGATPELLKFILGSLNEIHRQYSGIKRIEIVLSFDNVNYRVKARHEGDWILDDLVACL